MCLWAAVPQDVRPDALPEVLRRKTFGKALGSYDEASLDGRRQKVEELLSLDCCWRWWLSFLTGTMLQVRTCLGHNPVQIGIYWIYSRLTTRLLSMDSTGIMSTPSIRGTAEQLRSMVREWKEMAVKLSEFWTGSVVRSVSSSQSTSLENWIRLGIFVRTSLRSSCKHFRICFLLLSNNFNQNLSGNPRTLSLSRMMWSHILAAASVGSTFICRSSNFESGKSQHRL